MDGSSQRYIDFIGNLMPLYQHEQVDNYWCARSLRDGTLLLPKHDLDTEMDDDWITVWWQGDSARASEVQAYQMTSIALTDYVQFHSVGKASKHAADLLEHLSQHYGHKTGGHLLLPYAEEEMQTLGKVLELVKRFGPDAAWEILKKGLGL